MRKVLVGLLFGVIFQGIAKAGLDSASVVVSTHSFSTSNATPYVRIRSGGDVNYTVSDGTTTFSGVEIFVERTRDGGKTFQPLVRLTGEGSDTLRNSSADAMYRIRISTITGGTGWLTLTEKSELLNKVTNKRNEDMFTVRSDEVTLGATTSDTVYMLGIPVLPSNAAPRTNITPVSINSVIKNSTSGGVCISTGTTASTWVLIHSTSTACN